MCNVALQFQASLHAANARSAHHHHALTYGDHGDADPRRHDRGTVDATGGGCDLDGGAWVTPVSGASARGGGGGDDDDGGGDALVTIKTSVSHSSAPARFSTLDVEVEGGGGAFSVFDAAAADGGGNDASSGAPPANGGSFTTALATDAAAAVVPAASLSELAALAGQLSGASSRGKGGGGGSGVGNKRGRRESRAAMSIMGDAVNRTLQVQMTQQMAAITETLAVMRAEVHERRRGSCTK